MMSERYTYSYMAETFVMVLWHGFASGRTPPKACGMLHTHEATQTAAGFGDRLPGFV